MDNYDEDEQLARAIELSLRTAQLEQTANKGGSYDSVQRKLAIPLCLPNNWEWDPRTGECHKKGDTRSFLYVIQEALVQLRKIKGPVCVVSIAGTYRQGKSFVLSEAFNQPGVFPLGHAMEAETMGIWLWIVPEKYKQLKKAILAHGLRKGWSIRPEVKTERGYMGIKLRRVPRCEPGYEFGGTQMLRKVEAFMAVNPPPVPPIEIHHVPSDPRGAGLCAFASRDIERGEVVVEYTGEVISLSEAAIREEEYRRNDETCTLMVVYSGGREIAIDPNQGSEEGQTTWGAMLNHSQNNANLKPFIALKNSARPRVFLVALHDIPETVELLWNYNDRDWECHANSQTLPSCEN